LYVNTTLRLRSFGERSIIWRMTSEQAAFAMLDNTLDFCYIDADHRYEAAKQDIELWLSKVKSGGIICGHDYVPDGNLYNQADGSLIGLFGVQRAVNEFAASDGWDVHVTKSEDWPSWFAFKP
ncbi:MAG: class I SAM-dependent methyltransferase, partial [Verrucomicrobiota bacterium]|nr:class I SAM-dependent methyltransferase [Verrucomicrobiota bacterium]